MYQLVVQSTHTCISFTAQGIQTVGHFTICSVLFQELVKDHCYMAEDYIKELEAWTDNDYYENNVTKIQLPYNAAVGIFMDYFI